MKVTALIFLALAAFYSTITPVYWILSRDPAGTIALTLSFFLCIMIAGYLALVARRLPAQPEDKRRGEVAEGAGELGFFPPQSIWPLWVALAATLVFLGPALGWWLTILGFGFGAVAITGLLYEFYRGDHAH